MIRYANTSAAVDLVACVFTERAMSIRNRWAFDISLTVCSTASWDIDASIFSASSRLIGHDIVDVSIVYA